MSPSRAKPAISVIVTVYDRFEYLPEALGSVRDQTFSGPVEVLVVDDGSRQPSEEAFAGQFPEIRWLRQPNRGLCAARDSGTQAASGEFLVYLDDDDSWRAERLAAEHRFLQLCPDADLVYCDRVRFTPSGEAPRGYYGSALNTSCSRRSTREWRPFPAPSCSNRGHSCRFASSTTRWRRSRRWSGAGSWAGWEAGILRSGCRPIAMTSSLRAAYLGRVGYLNRPLARYRRGHSRITKGHVGPRFEESRILSRAMHGYAEPLQAAIRPGTLRYLARVGLLCARSRMFGRTWHCFRQSFVIDPRPTAVLGAWSSVIQSRISRRSRHRSQEAEYL